MSFIVIEGNATGNAALREFTTKRTQQGVAISNVTVAVNDRKYNVETESWEDIGRTFYEVTVTGEQAIHFASSAGNVHVEEYRNHEGAQHQRRRINAEHHGVSTKYAPAQVPETVHS
jgi:single-strand DNA-binding protein